MNTIASETYGLPPPSTPSSGLPAPSTSGHAMPVSCTGTLDDKPKPVHVSRRIANQEAMVIGFMSHHNQTLSMAPALIDLAKGKILF